jgi:hypothetical protein
MNLLRYHWENWRAKADSISWMTSAVERAYRLASDRTMDCYA